MKSGARFFFLCLASIVLVHCAKGATLGTEPGGDGGDGEGAGPSSGGGGTGSTGGSGGAPTTSSSGGTTTGPDTSSSSSSSSTSSSSSSSSSSSTSSSSSSTSSSSSSTSSSSSSSTSSSSSSSTTSSSSSSTGTGGSGPTDCDPLNPGAVCPPTDHCFPQPDGIPVCQGPVGPGGAYSACLSPDECQAPFNCIDTGDIFLSPCCLEWCITAADCPGGSTCEYLATPVYVGGTEYGVCYDGFGGC